VGAVDVAKNRTFLLPEDFVKPANYSKVNM
jgi:hypothetical protein